MRLTTITSYAVALLFAAPIPCFAWGVEGHQIVAHIAAHELTSVARAQVQDLLGGDAETTMVQVSTWADEIRRVRPNTAPWHFVGIPIGSAGYDPRRNCRNSNCIVAQIERANTILARPAARARRRLHRQFEDVGGKLYIGWEDGARAWEVNRPYI